MRGDLKELVLPVMVSVILLVALLLGGLSSPKPRPMPQCSEDAVLIGIGDYADGRWTGYQCGPALDDWRKQ